MTKECPSSKAQTSVHSAALRLAACGLELPWSLVLCPWSFPRASPRRLSVPSVGVSSRPVKDNVAWLVVFVVFALTRIPGMLPENFSAAYALMFCAGAFLRGRVAWWLPLAMMLATDLALNCYYHFILGWDVFTLKTFFYLAGNYVAYGALIWLGRGFARHGTTAAVGRRWNWAQRLASWLALVCGGLLGAVVFYLVTNTLAWLFNPFGNPEYTKTLAGWLQALTGGTAGWPDTWTFFRNTLGSGGLFTGLFAAALHVADALKQSDEEPAEEEAPAPEPAAEPEKAEA
jgi:hypothetical protein